MWFGNNNKVDDDYDEKQLVLYNKKIYIVVKRSYGKYELKNLTDDNEIIKNVKYSEIKDNKKNKINQQIKKETKKKIKK